MKVTDETVRQAMVDGYRKGQAMRRAFRGITTRRTARDLYLAGQAMRRESMRLAAERAAREAVAR